MRPGPVDLGVLGARLRQQTEIDDPITGPADPLEVEARSKLWPHAAWWARIELEQVSEGSGARRLEEYRFTPASTLGGLPAIHGPGLPVAIVFERSPNGASRARIYSARALVAQRAPMLPVDEHLQPARAADDVLGRHFAALARADLAATLEQFEEDGYLQLSSGEIHRGREHLRIELARCFESGGIELRFCSSMQDGPRTAFEVHLPGGRPAVMVYERGRSGRIGAVRLYL